MKVPGVLLALAIPLTFSVASAGASTPAGTQSPPAPPTQLKLSKPAPAPASAASPRNAGHTFEVNDEKGLLLTCIAPQIDADPDTDIFNSCSLAQGRTLDDVMHTFIQAIHFELDQRQKERDEWNKDLEERLAQKPAQK